MHAAWCILPSLGISCILVYCTLFSSAMLAVGDGGHVETSTDNPPSLHNLAAGTHTSPSARHGQATVGSPLWCAVLSPSQSPQLRASQAVESRKLYFEANLHVQGRC